MESKKEILLKYWPILGVALIFFGAEYIVFFYSEFNIDILQFIEWNEIIQSFLSIIVILVFVGLLGTIQIFIAQRNEDRERENEAYIKSTNEKRFLLRLKLYFIGYSVFFWLLIGNYILRLLGLIFSFFKDKSSWLDPLITYGITMLVLIAFNEISLKIRNLNSSPFYKKYITYTFILAAAFIAIAYLASFQAKTVIEKKPYYAIIQTKNDGNIVSNDSTIYVGKVKNFIFIYTSTSKSTTILPIDEVKRITIQANTNSH